MAHHNDYRLEELHSVSTWTIQALRLPSPSSPQKIRVCIQIEGGPCNMELDTGSAI